MRLSRNLSIYTGLAVQANCFAWTLPLVAGMDL
jgi:hypothetical protein